jgi:hypothetical protein
MAGDHGELLRRLGLVIELRVTEPQRLRQSKWLSARVSLDEDSSACRATRVHCKVAGDALVAAGAAQDDNWRDGALRIGNTERFSVLALDADGSALKMERYLWTLPRLQRAEENDDSADGATPSLRSPGFTVVAAGQGIVIRDSVRRQRQIETAFASGTVPELRAADIIRGLRVEVWDQQAQRWASLHHRLATVHVKGFGGVYSDLPEEGFLQGAAAHESPRVADSPIHIHEAVFGWEGWSLSAPRPGKSIVHDDGDETLESPPRADGADPEEGLVHPIRFEQVVAPGTLPRLRYGRGYAFRAWAVNLAGHSPPPPPDAGEVPAAAQPEDNPPEQPRARQSWLAAALRETAAESHARLAARLVAAQPRDGAGDDPNADAGAAVSGALLDTAAGTVVAERLVELRASRLQEGGQSSPFLRRELVHAAFGRALADAEVSLFPPEPQPLPASDDTITALQTFLRWEPVLTPAIVPRRRYTEGESLRVLVVRTGVRQDPDTLALEVSGPTEFAKAANKQLKGVNYFVDCQRHLAPPKASQMQAELHGKFDLAIGSDSAADHRKMLGWALRENGTFADTTRADIANPAKRLKQKGIAIVHVGMPTEPLKKLDERNPGDALAPGQTVIHDTDDLGLPYLPDPLARGISIVFPEAGRDRVLAFPLGSEGFTAAFGGSWPEILPIRLVFAGGEALHGGVSDGTLTFTVPAGESLRFRLASSLAVEDLDLLGIWRSLPPSLSGDADVRGAAADGLLWSVTPYEDVQLVHAVNRPLAVPRPMRVIAVRALGATHAHLIGAVELHGPSTDSLAAEAEWEDSIDDLSRGEPHQALSAAVAFQTRIRSYEDLALLSVVDQELNLPSVGLVAVHNARHELHDTRHRVVRYRFRAATRYREYFAPQLLTPNAKNLLDDGVSVISAQIDVRVPSSARPAAPIVHSVIPLFRWSRTAEPNQPLARRHVRRAGVRIYLERPWFSSGNDELLGILLAPGGDDEFGPQPEDRTGFPFVSKWGGDPIWRAVEIPQRALPSLALSHLLHAGGLDDRDVAARPVTPAQTLPLAALPEKPQVTVLGYRPQYNKERRLWYVDVALDPGDAFWPFVRLAVCRYQPDSVNECHLSAPVQCDFVQLPPERTTSVSRTDDRHVRVVVAGPVGHHPELEPRQEPLTALAAATSVNRKLVALLQKRDPNIASDLGWETVATTALALRGHGANALQAAWVGTIAAPEPIALTRPEGDVSGWRVLVEEWERLPTDPAEGQNPEEAWEGRMVFADSFEL